MRVYEKHVKIREGIQYIARRGLKIERILVIKTTYRIASQTHEIIEIQESKKKTQESPERKRMIEGENIYERAPRKKEYEPEKQSKENIFKTIRTLRLRTSNHDRLGRRSEPL